MDRAEFVDAQLSTTEDTGDESSDESCLPVSAPYGTILGSDDERAQLGYGCSLNAW